MEVCAHQKKGCSKKSIPLYLEKRLVSVPMAVHVQTVFQWGGVVVRHTRNEKHAKTALSSGLGIGSLEGGGWHKASVSDCLPLAAPIGLSPLLILTLCGSERVLVVSTEPLDDLSCLSTPGSAVPETGCCPCR